MTPVVRVKKGKQRTEPTREGNVMSLKEDIAISAKWLDECSSRIDGAALPGCTRNRVSAALFHLALEHHGAIQVLVSYEPSPLYGSAAALLRPQFEAYVRGVWYHRSASELYLKKFIRGDEPPKIDDLISNIETIPGFQEGLIKSVKKDSWKTMCGLTHGGVTQVASRNRPTEIVGDYTDDQVRGILYWASSVTLVVSVEFASLLKNNVMENELLSTYRSLFPKEP
jgi:hypothetical protein